MTLQSGTRAYKQLFEAWEELHLVPTGSVLLRARQYCSAHAVPVFYP